MMTKKVAELDDIEVSIKLPRALWNQVRDQAQIKHETEEILLERALEQFLKQEADKLALAMQLEQECEKLAALEFDDVGTEEEWLVVQNEAMENVEASLELIADEHS